MGKEENKAARQLLVDKLEAFMMGPFAGSPGEKIPAGSVELKDGKPDSFDITQLPSEFYHLGFLVPAGDAAISSEEDDQDATPDSLDNGAGDGIMSLANAARQSALGVTGCVDPETETLTVSVSWGGYQLKLDDTPEKGDKKQAEDKKIQVQLYWQRIPHEETVELILSGISEGKTVELAEFDGVSIYVLKRLFKGRLYLTVSVVNRKSTRFSKYKPELGQEDPSVYQVGCRLSADRSVFLPSADTGRRDDEEYWKHELMFHNVRQYAVGHGISADWEESEKEGKASAVYTTWIPHHEVFKASTEALESTDVLEVHKLSDLNHKQETLSLLRGMAEEYSIWIEKEGKQTASLYEDFSHSQKDDIQKAAEENLGVCREQLDRIVTGIQFLEDNDHAWRAFCLANEAMGMAMEKKRPGKVASWRAFQLAFILLSIPSVSDEGNPERELLDLIWFPTGGGKTEAYLGLTAYILFYRYLTTPADQAGGTAVITRYTLRLLTTQQFERAALTIFCCEAIRRREFPDYPAYSIGMLVGLAATPNRLADTQQILTAGNQEGQMLIPFENCPFCAAQLNLDCLQCDGQQYLLRCPDSDCIFSDSAGLPVHIVDEDIYNCTPSFIVATVDKLAQLAWRPEMAKILGCHGSGKGPDLIIQDELHLITDALGTMVALYEIAVDYLSSLARGGVRPKIIGSTATIRQADVQSWNLFERKVIQFPPSGLSHDDSFFYKVNRETNGRLYVGIHAQGKSPKHTLPRVIGTLAQSTLDIGSLTERDAYYTIVGYFNSLRELGGALVLAEDDVPRYIDSMPKTGKTRRLHQVKELTSQIPSREIPVILEEMNVGLDSEDLDREPLDLVLSTNMISVGVDVDRLGLMVVNGQPKTTAEYIQATSRVGRPEDSAGLVVTIYNWTRPRDRSHYERFVGYHGAFYRYVEAVSVTPFSPRARERGLPGVLASLIRSLSTHYYANESAVDYNPVGSELKQSIEEILRRTEMVDSGEKGETEKMLGELVNLWKQQHKKAGGRDLFWIPWGVQDRNSKRFMLKHMDDDKDGGIWRAQLSMRDVDPAANIALIR